MGALKETATGRSARTRAGLVEATLVRLRTDGSFTAEQVATDAGVSVATIYNRFPDGRDGLLAAAFDQSLERVVGASVETLTVENLLDNGLDRTMCTLVEELADVFTDEALVMRVALARLPESRLLRDIYRRHETIARQANRRFIELGQVANRISDGDADELADLLIVLGQGVNNPLVLGAADRRRLCARLSAVMVAALSPMALEVR
jgi:AcrR family transcriptional regulator